MPRRAIMMALAALYEVAMASQDVIVPRSLQLRALLTLLWRHSDGDCAPYRGFWEAVTEVTTQPHYRDGDARVMYARSNWLAIARGLGINPERTGAWNGMKELVEDHHRQQSGEAAAREALAAAVREAALTREIIATKGSPHSEEARALIKRRRADGLAPDGTKR